MGMKKGDKNMFEVEKKFQLNKGELKRLLKGAEFLGEQTFRDLYYDTADFTLSKNNIWLRKRGEQFQLKLPVARKEKLQAQTTQYQEIKGEEKIREIFAVAPVADFETDIEKFGYGIFCDLTTTRKKYQQAGFIMDLDQTVSNLTGEDDFSYQVVEVELMVESQAEIFSASAKIIEFAKKNKLKIETKKGKVLAYLFQKRPGHYRGIKGEELE
jgi:adenylate cyclase class IV